MILRIFTITWSHPKVSKGSDPQRSAPIIPNCSARSRLRAISTSFPLSLSISLTIKLQLLASRRFLSSSISCILYQTIVVHAH